MHAGETFSRLLKGARSTHNVLPIIDLFGARIVPILWRIGPVILLLVTTIAMPEEPAEESLLLFGFLLVIADIGYLTRGCAGGRLHWPVGAGRRRGHLRGPNS